MTGARAIAAGLLAACALVGFAAAFGLAAAAGADTGPIETTTTEPPAEPPPPEPPPPQPPPAAPIAFGVTVGGVSVGGLLPDRALAAVRRAYERPLVLVLPEGRRIRLAPRELGARADFAKAIRRARAARPGAALPLDVEVSRARVRAYVERLARRLDREPVDAKLVLDGVRPHAVPSREGRRLLRLAGARELRYALRRNTRAPIRLAFATLRPKVTTASLGQAIVILRESKRLLLFQGARLVRWFRIATGQPSYPTPLGKFEIVTKQRDPWWYPPPSTWARGQSPVPPGPGNPLGTRWMGLSAPYVGIHGTPDAASIGYSASHGCIRMKIPEAEWLFQRVKIGTPVFIVAR
jgi:lipoprotein-anchoring transpeptidase ErfK/SrfK